MVTQGVTQERKLTHEEECVTRGARWLDTHYPGWDAKIDLGELDVSSGWHCVLAQAAGEEFTLVLMGLGPESHLDMINLIDYGFVGGGSSQYPELNKAWRMEIERRRQSSER